MNRLPKIDPDHAGDIGAFARAAAREIQRADARLKTSVWRKETQYRVITRTDYAVARLHLDRAHRILHGLDRHMQRLEAPDSVGEPFYDPAEELKVERRLSERMYDI